MIRPINDWLVVKLDEDKKVRGELLLVRGDRVRTGTVLSVGPGRQYSDEYVPTEVAPGDKVAFFRENLEHASGKVILQHMEDGKCMLRESDILLVLDPDNPVEVSA